MTGDDKKFSLLEKLLRIEDDDTIFDPNSEPSTEGCQASLDHPVLSGHNRLTYQGITNVNIVNIVARFSKFRSQRKSTTNNEDLWSRPSCSLYSKSCVMMLLLCSILIVVSCGVCGRQPVSFGHK